MSYVALMLVFTGCCSMRFNASLLFGLVKGTVPSRRAEIVNISFVQLAYFCYFFLEIFYLLISGVATDLGVSQALPGNDPRIRIPR
jgi:hypothetical protein